MMDDDLQLACSRRHDGATHLLLDLPNDNRQRRVTMAQFKEYVGNEVGDAAAIATYSNLPVASRPSDYILAARNLTDSVMFRNLAARQYSNHVAYKGVSPFQSFSKMQLYERSGELEDEPEDESPNTDPLLPSLDNN